MANQSPPPDNTPPSDAEEPHVHGTTRVVDLPSCAVDACGCGTMHLHLPGLSIRMQRDVFRQVAYGFGLAAHKLDVADMERQYDEASASDESADAEAVLAWPQAPLAEA